MFDDDITNASSHSRKLQVDLNGNKLFVKIYYKNRVYQVEQTVDANLFDMRPIIEAVEKNEFTIISESAQTLKIQLAFLNLELKDKPIKNFETISAQFEEFKTKFARLEEQNTNLKQLLQDFVNGALINMGNFALKSELQQTELALQRHIVESNKRFGYLNPQKFSSWITTDDLKEESCIVNSKDLGNKIRMFFKHSQITLQLLYRASENNFEVSKFHEKCDGVKNTLVLCETEFGLKVGGFTPLSWQSEDLDEQRQSFIFSLTHNQKFILKDKSLPIQNDSSYGPLFGDSNLYISHRADTNSYSQININETYFSAKEIADKRLSKKLCGNESKQCSFRVWSGKCGEFSSCKKKKKRTVKRLIKNMTERKGEILVEYKFLYDCQFDHLFYFQIILTNSKEILFI